MHAQPLSKLNRTARLAILAATSGLGTAASSATAATYTFYGTASGGDWATAANWGVDGGTGSAVPASGDIVGSSQGLTTVVSSSVGPVDDLRFANKTPGQAYTANGTSQTATGTATLDIEAGGVLNISSATNGSAQIGNANASATGQAAGTLTINGGILNTTYTGTGDALNGKGSVIIANTASSTTYQGPTSVLQLNSGQINAGNNFVIGYGASVNGDGVTPDYSRGTGTQSGGSVNVAGAVVIGARGVGTYSISAGLLSQNGTNGEANTFGRDAFYVGQSNVSTTAKFGGQGTFTQSGSSSVHIANGLYIANGSYATGLYTVSGGTLTIAGDLAVAPTTATTTAGVSTTAAVAALGNVGRFQVNGHSATSITANHLTASNTTTGGSSTLGFGIASSAGVTPINLVAGSVNSTTTTSNTPTSITYDGSAQLSNSTLIDIDPITGFSPSAGQIYTLITAAGGISSLPTLVGTGGFASQATTTASTYSVLSISGAAGGPQSLIDTIYATPTPEPASLAIFGLASGAALLRRRRA